MKKGIGFPAQAGGAKKGQPAAPQWQGAEEQALRDLVSGLMYASNPGGAYADLLSVEGAPRVAMEMLTPSPDMAFGHAPGLGLAAMGALARKPRETLNILGVHPPTAPKTLDNSFSMLAAARRGEAIRREPPHIIRVDDKIAKMYPDFAEQGIDAITMNGNNGLLQAARLGAPYQAMEIGPMSDVGREVILDQALAYLIGGSGRPRTVEADVLPSNYWKTFERNEKRGLAKAMAKEPVEGWMKPLDYEIAKDIQIRSGYDFADALKAAGEGVDESNAGAFAHAMFGVNEPFIRSLSHGGYAQNMVAPSGRAVANPLFDIRKAAISKGIIDRPLSSLLAVAEDPTNPLLQRFAKTLIEKMKEGRFKPGSLELDPSHPLWLTAQSPEEAPWQIYNDAVLKMLPEKDVIQPRSMPSLDVRIFPGTVPVMPLKR